MRIFSNTTIVFIITGVLILFGVLSRQVLAGLSSSPSPPTPTPVIVTPSRTVVTIQNNQFSPQQINITPGTTVTWVNQDSTSHTTTSDNMNAAESWNSGTLSQNQSFSKTFTRPGVYTYRCSIHPTMQGTIQVVETTPYPTPTPTSFGQVIITPTPTPTPVEQLPTTGVSETVIAILVALIPLGIKLTRLDRLSVKNPGQVVADNLWQNRQFKKSD